MWQFLENFFENQARIKIDRFKQLPPLHAAAQEGNISNVRIYLHRGCDINKQDVYGKTPLDYAYETNNKEIIKILLKCPEIKVTIKDKAGCIPVNLSNLKTILPPMDSQTEMQLDDKLDKSEDNIDKLGETLPHL